MITRRDWDSNFFGLNIAETSITTLNECFEINSNKKELGSLYNLLYIFSDIELPKELFGEYIDDKIIYHKVLNTSTSEYSKNSNNDLFIYSGPISDKLYDLAIQSGHLSRFKLDQRIPNYQFENLYKLWIEKSCNSKDKGCSIICHGSKLNIDGLISTSMLGPNAKIELVAVDKSSRGKGIGNIMLNFTERYLSDLGACQIEVVTQGSNLNARNLYEGHGFNLVTHKYVYHWWLD